MLWGIFFQKNEKLASLSNDDSFIITASIVLFLLQKFFKQKTSSTDQHQTMGEPQFQHEHETQRQFEFHTPEKFQRSCDILKIRRPFFVSIEKKKLKKSMADCCCFCFSDEPVMNNGNGKHTDASRGKFSMMYVSNAIRSN